MEWGVRRRWLVHSPCFCLLWYVVPLMYYYVGSANAVLVSQLPHSNHLATHASVDRSAHLQTMGHTGKNSILLCQQSVPKSCSKIGNCGGRFKHGCESTIYQKSKCAFLSPVSMFRKFFRKTEFRDSQEVGCSEVSGSTGGVVSRVEEAIEAAVAAASSEALKRLNVLRCELQQYFVEEVLKCQEPDLRAHQRKEEMPPTEKDHVPNLLPVTARTANATEEAACAVFVKSIGVARKLGATDVQIDAARARVVDLVAREVKSLYQLQMQQHILRLLYQFLQRIREEGQLPLTATGGSKAEDALPRENVSSSAAAAAVDEFQKLISTSAPTNELQKKWGCVELQQLLQRQLAAHKKQQQEQYLQVGNERRQQQQQMQALFRVVQHQQSQLQHAQQQLQQEQQPRPFAVGAAYRVPDTNLQISAASRQGRLQLNVTCVPDDSPAAAAGVLGQQGFVRGIETFGNLGLSCSFSV